MLSRSQTYFNADSLSSRRSRKPKQSRCWFRRSVKTVLRESEAQSGTFTLDRQERDSRCVTDSSVGQPRFPTRLRWTTPLSPYVAIFPPNTSPPRPRDLLLLASRSGPPSGDSLSPARTRLRKRLPTLVPASLSSTARCLSSAESSPLSLKGYVQKWSSHSVPCSAVKPTPSR